MAIETNAEVNTPSEQQKRYDAVIAQKGEKVHEEQQKQQQAEEALLHERVSEQTTTQAATEAELEDPSAAAYLEHLLNDGAKEGDCGAEMEMPAWYDERMFAKGQTYMSRYRFVMTSGMLAGLVAVLAIPSILRVLICTRQSSTPATAFRRYVRTILHTNAWYDNKATVSKDSKFWTSLRAVRKAHAHSSRASVKMGTGLISQKDLALTQFGFIGFITLGAHRIQMYDEEFLECTSHMWRVLGHLLGIKDEYNICGPNWAETKKRLDIVMRRVYRPALEQTSEEFAVMTKALLEGLWPVNATLTVGSFLYFTKRLAYVPGYEYFDFDYVGGRVKDNATHRLTYKALGWWDRFVVSYGLFMVTYMHKYDIVRWYLNFRVWLNERLVYYLPYLAMWKFGFKTAYVRIFTSSGKGKEYTFGLLEN